MVMLLSKMVIILLRQPTDWFGFFRHEQIVEVMMQPLLQSL